MKEIAAGQTHMERSNGQCVWQAGQRRAVEGFVEMANETGHSFTVQKQANKTKCYLSYISNRFIKSIRNSTHMSIGPKVDTSFLEDILIIREKLHGTFLLFSINLLL